MTADNPHIMLEQLQLTEDLVAICGSVYTRAGVRLVAEQLYDRGVRSRLHAPRRTEDRIHFTSDPETGRFRILEPGEYELVMELDKPDVELRPIDAAPVRVSEVGFYRLVKRAELVQTQLMPMRCPWCEWSFDALVDGRIPWHKRSFMTDWMECHGSRERVAENGGIVLQMSEVPGHATRQVPGPIPERKLPDGVQRVIQFAEHASPDPDSLVVLRSEDLKATIAEIPDVAPRYPTIWAYEQACRTIRERDDRIEKALERLSKFFTKTRPIGPDPDDIAAVESTLRLRMPRIEPATPEQLSEVARAFELVQGADPDVSLEGWAAAATTLRDEVLRLAEQLGERDGDLRDVVVLDEGGQPVPCGTCSALEPPVTKLAVDRTTAGWPRCVQHLVQDELVAAGYRADVKTCPSCHHLASSHFENGSGCSVTIRDVGLGADGHCPCTFDARSVHRG
jgi:hypothetical protein